MTIEEKLELFYQTAIEDATQESVALLAEYEETLEQQYNISKDDIIEKANHAYHLEEEELLRGKNKILSQASRDVKKQMIEEEKSYEVILFSMVEEKLQAYMKTNEYEEKLVCQINEAKEFAEGDDITYYINASDKERKEMLESKTGVVLTISDTNFIGGIRAVIRSRNLLIDQSLLAKITEEREHYTMQ